jgi:hypothetical protein
MADLKILNLDEILAEQTERVVIWEGVRHPVVGMTGEAYLKFLSKRKALDKAQKDGDEAAQWEQNLAIIGIVVPTLADKRAALLALRLSVLTKLTEYIMTEFTDAGGKADQTGGASEQPGESTLPG